MATTSRQPKPARKGPPGPDPARRQQAWTGARASPTFSPSSPSARSQGTTSPAVPAAIPPLAQQNGTSTPRDRILASLSGLTGTTITLSTKTGQRYEAVVGSTSGEGDTTGVTLKDVKEISSPGAPLKDSLFIASTNIENWSSGPADAPRPTNGDTFRTDTDISQKKSLGGRERELQAWVPSTDPPEENNTFDLTSGPGGSWDQFAANEQMFGVTTSFDEDVYTTKLDRNAIDFKEREKKAQRIANEILSAGTSNPHIAEERGHQVDDSGVNEEDKYGAVVRGTNAYVPPGARRGGPIPAVATAAPATKPSADVPKVSVNGPDGTAVQASPASSKAASPAPPAAGANKPPADPLPAFRDFVTNEKQRLTQKRQALMKNDMDKRMAELVKFSQSFKLNKPIPDDLVPILAKDEDKQRLIKEKAQKDSVSTQARAIGASTPATASRGVVPPAAKAPGSAAKPTQPTATKQSSGNAVLQVPISASAQKTTSAATKAPSSEAANASTTGGKKINMVIQVIPPFRGSQNQNQNQKQAVRQSTNGVTPPTSISTSTAAANSNGPTVTTSNPNIANATSPVSPNTAAMNRLNVNANAFLPGGTRSNALTPPAPAAKPIANGASNNASARASPKPRESGPSTPNPFFGTRPIKKSAPVHIKDDFNPFKHNKVVDAAQVAPTWPYNGKRYNLMFPAPQHQPQQHPSHMMPPGPPPMPPPSYEEDSAAQAAARGYVYAYPPYGYPGQPMMPGMPPPGPPGTYMPGHFMQPMPYPPGMPPPNAMYSPAMGQMPPPQAYMQPPPGAYPPPPNGAGPRPSMPPTPIPTHAHSYYHQSPQLQHAVPYPMMMPPPQNVPPHPYEGGPPPPVQMGGHA